MHLEAGSRTHAGEKLFTTLSKVVHELSRSLGELVEQDGAKLKLIGFDSFGQIYFALCGNSIEMNRFLCRTL